MVFFEVKIDIVIFQKKIIYRMSRNFKSFLNKKKKNSKMKQNFEVDKCFDKSHEYAEQTKDWDDL